MSKRSSSGWVVRSFLRLDNGRTHISWWYGPDRSWGHTYGPLIEDDTGTLSIAVAVFSTRREAREAIALIGLRSCTPVRLSYALEEVTAKERAS